jgi:hypothetical protein
MPPWSYTGNDCRFWLSLPLSSLGSKGCLLASLLALSHANDAIAYGQWTWPVYRLMPRSCRLLRTDPFLLVRNKSVKSHTELQNTARYCSTARFRKLSYLPRAFLFCLRWWWIALLLKSYRARCFCWLASWSLASIVRARNMNMESSV